MGNKGHMGEGESAFFLIFPHPGMTESLNHKKNKVTLLSYVSYTKKKENVLGATFVH